jgi:hypothetical protein
MSGRASQEIAEEKLAEVRGIYESILARLEAHRTSYCRSSGLIAKSREAIKRSNALIGQHGLKDLYKP